MVIGDEIDQWASLGNIDNLADLKKRTRSYNSSICFLVCTPTTENGNIWREFLKGSQGYWYLRCKGCGELTLRSCDIHNMQFESEYDDDLKQYIVKEDTIRLVCPVCGHEHVEDDKKWMNINGSYIHRVPERIKDFPTYQIGALASQLKSLSWKFIANAQLEAGKKADIETQVTFDNSIRGLPYKHRQVTKEEFEKIRLHCWTQDEAPTMKNVEMMFLVADTQDNRSVVGIFALDVNDNLHLVEAKEVEHLSLTDEERNKINSVLKKEAFENNLPFTPVITVEDMLHKQYLVEDGIGITPTFALIDRQGHRTNDIQFFADKNTNVMMYQGAALQTSNWRISDNNKRLILAAAKHWQSVLIYYLYSQKKRRENYLYFTPDISDAVLKQIVCVKPDNTKKFGSSPENWVPQGDAVHDYFDVCKMAYLAVDFAIQTMSRTRWKFCQSPALKRRWSKQTEIENSVKQQTPDINENKENRNSWFKL